jgi:hypothetical protein
MRRSAWIAIGLAAGVLAQAAAGARAWPPAPGTPQAVTSAIAAYVAPRYRLDANGGQLLKVTARRAEIRDGGRTTPVTTVAVRKKSFTDDGIAVHHVRDLRSYTLCGAGPHCALPGTPSLERGRLVRREALELALHTFRYVPTVDALVCFLPPSPGRSKGDVLYLRRADLAGAVAQPFEKTLPLEQPPLPNDKDLAEAAAIDRLTLTRLYELEYDGLEGGGWVMILSPDR